MFLYKISQNVNNNYDTYDSVIVAAESEEDARMIRPDTADWGSEQFCSTWVSDPKDVIVELIGISFAKNPGIILASFNAG
jgi:hypothetical protein